MKRFNQYALRAMEKLDSRDTFLKSLGYEYARRIFVISFKAINGYSPYDYKRMGDEEMTPEEYEDFVENGDWFIDTEKES